MNRPTWDLVDLDHYPFRLDIRYARTDNFMGKAVYPMEKAFLQECVAEDLALVHEALAEEGFGILVFDGYRPWIVTKIFWDWANEDQKKFLANPQSGSTHNRGCAVDCSLYDLKSGREVKMPSAFDTMDRTAWIDYEEGDQEALRNRDLLISTMSRFGFEVLKHEWWHFNHSSASDYPILNLSFPDVLASID
jgi:D-alanyl-D-alanine dipeptidase